MTPFLKGQLRLLFMMKAIITFVREVYYIVLHVHCITLYYIVLHCITLYYIVLHCITFIITFYYILLHCIIHVHPYCPLHEPQNWRK